VEGSEGKLEVINPYHPHWFHRLKVQGQKGSYSENTYKQNAYVLQLRAFLRAIQGEKKLSTDPADAVANMRVIDAIYEKAGLQKRGT
jgi:predicted dehydrogenase